MDIGKFMKVDGEKPLDNILENGGFTGIFHTIACIGDSLSSGEWQARREDGTWRYYDMFWYSWGQYIARMTGAKVYNFSKGGMTAENYMKSFALEKDFWNPAYAAQAYIIAMGVNDISRILAGAGEVGSIEDIAPDWRDNKKTAVGYYAAMIQRYKTISPDAKFFLVTQPRDGSAEERSKLQDKHAEILYEICGKFDNCYVIDLRKYGPVYDEAFRKMFYLNGHMSPMGYQLTAKMIASYIDYIIRNNPEDFLRVGFFGTDIRDYPEK